MIDFEINLNSNPQFVKNFEKFVEENQHLIESVAIIPLTQYRDEGRFNFIIEAKIWKLNIPRPCDICSKDPCICHEDRN